MKKDDAIINPAAGKSTPKLGPVSLMVASRRDLQILCDLFKIDLENYVDLYLSRLYIVSSGTRNFSMVGPMLGAPYATIIIETLIAWGASKIVFFGWCGAVSDRVAIGDLIVPDRAIIEEGTSKHYGADERLAATPSTHIVEQTKRVLNRNNIDFHEGAVWTTDALFRETREKIGFFQSKHVLAVEMETSALFTVGGYRSVAVGALLVVSDELATLKWKPGFRDKKFSRGRQTACNVMGKLCREL